MTRPSTLACGFRKLPWSFLMGVTDRVLWKVWQNCFKRTNYCGHTAAFFSLAIFMYTAVNYRTADNFRGGGGGGKVLNFLIFRVQFQS